MATTESRTGFRLPWSADRNDADGSDEIGSGPSDTIESSPTASGPYAARPWRHHAAPWTATSASVERVTVPSMVERTLQRAEVVEDVVEHLARRALERIAVATAARRVVAHATAGLDSQVEDLTAALHRSRLMSLAPAYTEIGQHANSR